LHPKFTRYSI